MKTKLFCFMKNAYPVLVKVSFFFIIFLFDNLMSIAQSRTQEQLELDSNETKTVTHRADTILSTQKIMNGADVKYLAHDRVRLNNSFKVDRNSKFRAEIVQKCKILEEKVDTVKMKIMHSKQSLEAHFKSLEAHLFKVEEDTLSNLPNYEYFFNFGDGNFQTFKSTDNFNRELEYIYRKSGTYEARVHRVIVKLPPVEPIEDKKVIDFNLTNIGDTTITVNSNSTIAKPNTMKEFVKLTAVPENPIPGQLVTIIASLRSETEINSSTAKLSYEENTLLNGNMDIYYDDTDGTKSCEDTLTVNIFDIGQNEQRNFFSYFTVDSTIVVGGSIKVCLEHEMKDTKNDTCQYFKIGNPHDPSYKRLTKGSACLSDDLDFLIHIENDGIVPTKSVIVKDYFEPVFDIKSVTWDEETDCQKVEGWDTISENKDTLIFTFDSLVIEGQGEPGYIPTGEKDATMEEFSFKVKLEEPILDPTYWCNKADIIFDSVPPYTIETCFYCFGKNYQFLNDSIPPTKEYFINGDTIEKEKPVFFKENLFTTMDKQTITITPDLCELPDSIDEFEYIWWPNQETTPKITVSPTENTNYRLRVSWMQDNTLCYATDYVFVEVQCFYGCTNPDACNYDSFAQCDDGKCTYCEIEESDTLCIVKNDTIFSQFNWLEAYKDTCQVVESINITHYNRNSFDIIRINIEGDTNYYYENGNFIYVREDSIISKYLNEDYTICSWECKGKKRTLCETYPWLSKIFNSNISGGGTSNNNNAVVIKSFKYYSNQLLYLAFDDDDDNVADYGTIYFNGYILGSDNGDGSSITSLNVDYQLDFIKNWPCQTINCTTIN